MKYRLQVVDTALTVGHAACLPEGDLSPDQACAHLAAHSNDWWMFDRVVSLVRSMDPADREALARHGSVVVRAAVRQAALLNGDDVPDACGDPASLASATPTPALAVLSAPDHARQRAWTEALGANVLEHKPLPDLTSLGEPPCTPDELDAARRPGVPVATVRKTFSVPSGARDEQNPTPDEVASAALTALREAGFETGYEQRHVDSLSPVAVFRRWGFSMRVASGGLDYALSGEQTSFGRGLWMDEARAACAMEVAERRSAWLDVAGEAVAGRMRETPLKLATPDEMREQGHAVLDVTALRLEAPHDGGPLWWMEGAAPGEQGDEPVWLPVQLAGLFVNLDERQLFTGYGSTGLGAGATMAWARRAALLECIERDAEACAPFDPSRCFRLAAKDRGVADLLVRWHKAGIQPVLMDITPPWGVPCYKAFVMAEDGSLARGASASLDGRRAVLSALTEVPHPFPDGPLTRPWDADWGELPVRQWEKLPSFATQSALGDMALLEATLAANGLQPVYADLTRADLRVPACRAIVPGLETAADFDRFYRVSPRLVAAAMRLGS